ncbi:FAD-dependent oxidoreductase [Clostridium thermopalmarium]|uniref:NADH:ubiquinone reductase (non-electrogenic) n=1 Tax=Clostridium thermopalmarium DSM 5974 TaxID=1121340 RepID=A0A2T0AR52_9CLOT|nr:FAD-dependent oxidoreductase [Clostridium thermopalmarium]PRR72027.1 NADH dehydrogenase-like protein YjlD [Clostridium thermopalmarium DSM 5974]PVZ23679.1 NADH dehydrogenase FAD-containing subunit [Clostridium thermopalmarium DSM 5974]
MSANTKILILGAGYGGVHVAKKLAKKYKKNDSIEITLIDKNPFHTLMTELHEVAGGRVHPESVQIELSKIFGRTKVNVVTDYIEKVDTDKKVVTTSYGKYEYDYLVIGTGSEPAFFGVPGVKENGFTLWSFEDAIRIREHIQTMFSLASKERNEKKRKEMLTFVVAGSGFTGIEMAGELLEWKSKLAREYNVDEKEVKLLVVEAMSTILNMLDRGQADKAEKYMKKHGMEILKDSPIVEVNKNSIKLKDGKEIPTQTLIWTCGIQANQESSEYGLQSGRAGRLIANEFMQASGKKDVFVVGDIAYYEEEPGRGTPQIVEAALQTGDTIVKNIIASIENTKMTKFKSNYHGFMVSIGGKYCVANLSGIKLSGFFAMLMKHLVNLHYLWGVNGINACYHYLIHEFFSIEDKRNIMRGHLSSKGNRLWLVPLRLFMGVIWLLEGLEKFVGESTWADKGFKALLNGPASDSWIKAGNIKMPFEWLQTAANSGASEAASTASETATPILSHMPSFYSTIMKIMIPSPEIAVWFQRMVVCIEIGIGLALLAGLFTFLASAASAFMVTNFILSAMAGWDILWYFFGAIALMGGAGRTFGLDYWVIPWISKTLSNWWFGKRVPVYNQKTSL